MGKRASKSSDEPRKGRTRKAPKNEDPPGDAAVPETTPNAIVPMNLLKILPPKGDDDMTIAEATNKVDSQKMCQLRLTIRQASQVWCTLYHLMYIF